MPNQCILAPNPPAWVAQVRFNVQAALEGLGLVPSDTRQKEEQVLREVQDILRPVMNRTWPSGRPENN